MLVIIAGLSAWLYLATRPDYDRIDNDLKYRYIKMKGKATPTRISELEDLFKNNRDNAKFRQINKDAENYERAVQKKATLDKQARLRQQEAEQLNKEANSIKNNKRVFIVNYPIPTLMTLSNSDGFRTVSFMYFIHNT